MSRATLALTTLHVLHLLILLYYIIPLMHHIPHLIFNLTKYLPTTLSSSTNLSQEEVVSVKRVVAVASNSVQENEESKVNERGSVS